MMYEWSEIPSIPHRPGVYAWYYKPEITVRDLDDTVVVIRSYIEAGDDGKAREVLHSFLEDCVFRYFKEEPFTISLRGPLKPTYVGKVDHQPSVSESLINRILEDPQRLSTLKEVLEASSPEFASPLYIGMAERLGVRLNQHRMLIERYRARQSHYYDSSSEFYFQGARDHGFAKHVSKLHMDPMRLFVFVRFISGEDKPYLDIENMLNRIHYPLFGRN